MIPPSRTMFTRELPMSVIREISSQLDIDNRWMQLVDNIPKTLNAQEFVPKYKVSDTRKFEQVSQKLRGSPTMSVIEDWSTINPTLGHLIVALEKAGLISTVRYLVEDFLKEAPIAKSPDPPRNGLPHLDLPPSILDLLPSQFHGWQNDSSKKSELYRTFEGEEVNFYSFGGSDDKLLLSAPPGGYEKFKGDKMNEIEELLLVEPVISHEVKDNVDHIHHVTFNDLRTITDRFNDNLVSRGGRVIGKGGFGTVYLGIDHDNKRVAVKKTALQHETSVKQFKAELNTLSQHRHINLLPLLAYSCDSDSLCIIYDYMSSGSLEERLACKGGSPALPPFLRVDIASGTGHGITYLNGHGLVHRDIKSANILLDEKFTPKLGDFATTRLGPSGKSKTIQQTTTVIGTSAYLAPEAHTFDISSKLDSFSFGVVLLELITGLPAFDVKRENKDLRSHILEESENIADMLDRSGGSWMLPVANSVYDIAKRCLHLKKKKRVTVSEIIGELDAV